LRLLDLFRCYTVYLRPRPRHPDGAAAAVALRDLVGGDDRQLGFLPADLCTFKDFGRDVAVAEPGRRAFAQLAARVADDNDGLTGETGRPVLDVKVAPPRGARNQARVGCKVVIDANVNKRRHIGGADETI
jgi:hypothetical protein